MMYDWDQYEIIVLDFDGVIMNLDIDWQFVRQKASKLSGFPIDSMLKFFKEYHRTPLFDVINKEVEKFELDALKKASPKPKMMDFLRKTSETEIKTYLATMQSAIVMRFFLDEYEMTKYFQEILTRNDFPNKLAQLKHILEKNQCDPSKILFIDDSLRNISTCKSLGIVCFHHPRNID